LSFRKRKEKEEIFSLARIRDYDDLYTIVLLFATWLLISGDFSYISISLGFLISYLTVTLIHSSFTRVISKMLIVNFFAVISYLLLLIKEIIIASYQVAYLALHPDLPFESVIVKATTKVEDEHKTVTMVILGNSITLTPGTLTVDLNVKDKLLYIHCLDDVNTEKDDEIREKIFANLEKGIRRIFE